MKKVSKFFLVLLTLLLSFGTFFCTSQKEKDNKNKIRPNILILMSDNHSWNHLGCYGDPVVKTPVIDELARNGIRFTNAYCTVPSCAPARAAMLTGQDFFRLEEAANLWGSFPKKFTVYTDILEEAGYLVGSEGKGWGPGNCEVSGWETNPGGKKYNSFEEFFNEKERGQPFCYWFSSRDPHRPYKPDGWKELESNVEEIPVPPYLPDVIEVKKDIGDYYSEIENFDRDVGAFVQLLKEVGEYENTLIIVCSDNGWQMPRGLANLYDFGLRVPLIVSMPSTYKGGRVINDFVSLNDFAPTFLEITGVQVPEEMNAKSFLNILNSDQEGIVDQTRDYIVAGRERHAFVRKGGKGYGARSIRTNDFLYIRNYDFDSWPAGDPPLYGDVDAHMLHYPSLTKMYMLKNRENDAVSNLFELGFGKRPAEELYDLKDDPFQMHNIAYSDQYKNDKEALSGKLTEYLKVNGDPRETGEEMKWIGAPYYAEKDKYPRPGEEARKELNLKEEYSYVED